MGSAALNKLKSVILLSWIVILTISGIIIYQVGIGRDSRKVNATLEDKLMSVSAELERCRMRRAAGAASDEDALKFVEWQFVVRDQADALSRRLETEISKEKETKKNQKLLNAMHYNLGLSYVNSMDFDSAIAEFQKALKYNSSDKWSLYNLGLLYSVLAKDSAKAADNYKRYLAVAGKDDLAGIVKERLESLTKRKE